jgi:hypothetical protein
VGAASSFIGKVDARVDREPPDRLAHLARGRSQSGCWIKGWPTNSADSLQASFTPLSSHGSRQKSRPTSCQTTAACKDPSQSLRRGRAEPRDGGARDVLGADVVEERRVPFEEVFNTLNQDIGAFRAPLHATGMPAGRTLGPNSGPT